MTGLDLEGFLHLLRADLGAWATLALIAGVLALMAWTSWGSRRALRKCLVLSVLAHCGLALYGGTVPVVLLALKPDRRPDDDSRIRSIKVSSWTEPEGGGTEPRAPGPRSADGKAGAGSLAAWDKPLGGLALADAKLPATKTETGPVDLVRRTTPEALAAATAAPDAKTPAPPAPEARPRPAVTDDNSPTPPKLTAASADEVAPAVVAPKAEGVAESASLADRRLRADRTRDAGESRTPRSTLATETLVDASSMMPPAPAVTARPEAGPSADATPAVPRSTGSASEAGVAAADVIPLRPDSPKVAVSDANLRGRGRPGGRVAAAPGVRPAPPALPVVSAPALDGAAAAPGVAPPPRPAVERPASGEPNVALAPGASEEVPGAEVLKTPVAALPRVASPESDVRRRTRPPAAPGPVAGATNRRTPPSQSGPLALARVTPNGVPALPEVLGAAGGRPLADVPEVYRSRLDPNRTARAFHAGASPASEQAVERALDWLARHQDNDGRWDGATAKYDDGTAVKGDDDFTVHCPPGETCFGESVYFEADTALTGLALLAYLGAGYTQADGKYAETVGKALDFLLSVQKPDGDLRGTSKAVGMYCHAMASIALCEAYALTGDERLRGPVERAVGFIARARAADGLAWRYAPGAPVGDTSLLGWVVMALKSAREVGIEVPSTLQTGTVGWLDKVAAGDARGLARYQPQDHVTPTMTAEAWVCRQFLGLGGPGPASTEAAGYLLSHGPKTETYNLYYMYYGTLAMYQHGGPAWTRWNAEVRDEIVRRQRPRGHTAGSWDPDESVYGAKGGRIYCTSLAALSLEVYYRYLRLYDEPNLPPTLAPSRTRALGRSDGGGPAQYRQSAPRR